jgi:hypothetical protein
MRVWSGPRLLPALLLIALALPTGAHADEAEDEAEEEAEDEAPGVSPKYASRWRAGRAADGVVIGYQVLSLGVAVGAVVAAANFRTDTGFLRFRMGLAWGSIGIAVMSLGAMELIHDDGQPGARGRGRGAALLRGAAYCGLYGAATAWRFTSETKRACRWQRFT